ncbi:GTPase [Streptomyces stramineus]|uniref:GTPase n=1 Tax=Streptomyces stramineus TaxID=173861 RepID=UPI003CD0A5BA
MSESRDERADRPVPGAPSSAWDDGLIARRARPGRLPRRNSVWEADEAQRAKEPTHPPIVPEPLPAPRAGTVLRPRLDALRELVGLSRARLDRRTLAEAGRVLEEAAARQRHSLDLTVVAIAGATGSGKSTLFNALARTQLSEAGVRRPTTAIPIACAWTDRSDRADGLLDRLGIPARARRAPVRPYDPGLNGLVLLDLPDHDSATPGHREQVDRLLRLVDAVIWVVDPEKYADAVLHERYLRPLAGYAEVTFVVLNQVDRLSGDAADQVLDDLRRLLDEDGIALGEHGEPGATVLALSALTGDRVGELREMLAQFTAGRNVPERRLVADVDGVSARLRPAYIAKGRPGLTETARQEFEDRLAEAVGAHAAGLAAERAWLRDAERACGTSWTQARRWYGRKRGARGGAGGDSTTGVGAVARAVATAVALSSADRTAASAHAAGTGEPARRTASRPLVEQAVRALAYEASAGLPDPWAQAVREAAGRGAEGLAEALDTAAATAASAAARGAATNGRTSGRRAGAGKAGGGGRTAKTGTSGKGGKAGKGGKNEADGAEEAVVIAGAAEKPEGSRTAAGEPGDGDPGTGRPGRLPGPRTGAGRTRGGAAPRLVRPRWWVVAATSQGVLSLLQLLGAVWLVGVLIGAYGAEWWVPGLVLAGSGVGGPALAWCCRAVARGPARRHGLETERRLRSVAAGCGRERVLEPVAAELLRYREVRAQFVIAAGEV